MRIHSVQLNNYKAFRDQELKLEGKNVFIYGENGSGKSSFYSALYDFLVSSNSDINFDDSENIFINDSAKGNGTVTVRFRPIGAGKRDEKEFHFSSSGKYHGSDTTIKDADKHKNFVTYKHLIKEYNLGVSDELNFFDFLVNGVLAHLSIAGSDELGSLWSDVVKEAAKERNHQYNATKKRKAVENALKKFNQTFGLLFDEGGPEYIGMHIKPILDYFKTGMVVKFNFSQVRLSRKDPGILENVNVGIGVTYATKNVKKPHLFLNEARLSALVVSIYLGMIKRKPQGLKYQILFLDDIFIGLDISNRLPLLEILKDEFSNYQIFITTYDKPWFEFANSFIDKSSWKTIEFYARKIDDGYDIPFIPDTATNLLAKAQTHLAENDYKACAVYVRSAFEKAIMKFCDNKRIPVKYSIKQKNYSSEDFWKAINEKFTLQTKVKVKEYRDLVLNVFCHYNTEKHEIRSELENAIDVISEMELELRSK